MRFWNDMTDMNVLSCLHMPKSKKKNEFAEYAFASRISYFALLNSCMAFEWRLVAVWVKPTTIQSVHIVDSLNLYLLVSHVPPKNAIRFQTNILFFLSFFFHSNTKPSRLSIIVWKHAKHEARQLWRMSLYLHASYCRYVAWTLSNWAVLFIRKMNLPSVFARAVNFCVCLFLCPRWLFAPFSISVLEFLLHFTIFHIFRLSF